MVQDGAGVQECMEAQVLLVLRLPVGQGADARYHGDGEALQQPFPQTAILQLMDELLHHFFKRNVPPDTHTFH